MPQALNGIKSCSRCGETKPVSEFSKHRGYKDGFRYECKKCSVVEVLAYDKKHPEGKNSRNKTYRDSHKEKVNGLSRKHRNMPKNKEKQKAYIRNWHLVKTYGITSEDYNNMFIEQGGRCAICGKHQTEFKKRLAVDHCHDTGKVRGLLCDSCNNGIGKLKDDIQLLTNAIKYLEQS